MAQIIRHRRGSLEALSAATSSFQKGELIIVSGSSNITASNGSGMVFAAVESGSIQAVNRFIVGNNAPNVFPAGTYNGLVKGVPYYASGSSTLYLLGEGGNDIINLVGNIQPFSASVATSINALSSSIGGGLIGNSVSLLSSKTGSYATTGSNVFVGAQIISSSLPEVRFENSLTGKAYHIANTGTELVIHANTGIDIVRIESGSSDYSTFVQGNLLVRTGTISGSINGIGNVTAFSSSVDSRFSASVASVTALSASVASVTGDFSSSVATSFSASNANVVALSASVASVTGNFSSSVATSFSASNASIVALSASVASVTGDFSSSVAQTFTTQSQRITSLEAFSGSQLTQNTALATITGSLITSASTAKSTNDTQDGRLTNIETFSASVNTSVASLNSFSSSQLTQNTALATISGSLISSASNAAVAIANLNANSGSYAILSGSNVFYGTQVITGSLFVAYDLIVQGSSSVQYITASQVDLGTNTIVLNNDSPAVRFGGISVVDSGSAQGASGSLFWDSLNNNWIYQHPSGGAESGQSAILISGPRNSGSLGNEEHITPGKIMVATGDDHIGDSIITQVSDNSKVNISGGLGVSGSIVVNNAIIGTGSIFLQPDITDSRKLEIYNTAATDIHIKATGGLTFLGDDTNYVKIDDSLQTVTVRGVNGVFIETGLNVTGPISSSAGFSGSIEGIGNVTAYSQSVSASFASVIANVGSGVGVSITNLNSFSSSQLTQNSTLATYTGSVETRLIEVGVVSGSLIASASAAKITNDSQDISITNLNSFSSSQLSKDATLATYTGSVETRLTEVGVVSGSLILSASAAKTTNDLQSGRLTNLESTSASVNISIAALNTSSASQQTQLDSLSSKSGSYATTGSNTFYGTQTISGSINVSGSTNFGGAVAIDDSNMNLTNSSSLNLTNGSSIFVNGSGVISGSIVGIGNVTAFSTSVDARLNALSTDSGSQAQRLTALETTSASVNTSVAALNSSSASQQTSIDALNAYTSSNTSTPALNAFTASANERFTEIGVVSGSLIASASTAKTTNDSQGVSISNLNTFSGSQLTQNSTLASYTGSVETRLTEIGVVSGSLISSASTAKTTNDAQDGRLTNLESTSASVNISVTNLNTFSSSVLTRLTEIGVVSGSLITSASTAKTTNDSQDVSISNLNTFSGSSLTRFTNLESTSASVNTSIAALNSYTSSNTSTNALNAFTASAIDRFTEIGVVSGSLISSASAAAVANTNQNTFTQSANVRLNNLESTSASVNTSLFNINSFTESADVRLDNLEAKSASVDTSVFNINSFSSSTLISLTNLASKSASVDTSIFNINGTTASLNTSVAALNTYSSSLKTAFEFTGSNVVVLGDLVVKGTTTAVESNVVQLGDNIIELNGTGAANGGLLVKDPTAPNTVSGSLLWDSTNDYWKAGAAGAESKVALMGGDNLVTSSQQILFDQINGYSTFSGSVATSFSSSNASITSLSASVASVTGDFSSSVATSFSASAASQLLLSSSLNTSFSASQAIQNDRLGLLEIATGSLNSFTSSIDTTIKTKLNVENVVSGAAQITITDLDGYSDYKDNILLEFSASNASITSLSASVANVTGNFSSSVATSFSASAATVTALSSSLNTSFSSSQAVQDGRLGLLEIATGSLNSFTSSIDTTIKTKLNVETVVSGSSQIDITQTTGFTTFSSSIETRISIIDGGTY